MASLVGSRVERKEDKKLLTGRGKYTADVTFAHQTYAYFVRSPHARAQIKNEDISKAVKASGVVSVLTGKDIVNDKIGGLIAGWRIKSEDGSDMKVPPHPPLASESVNYVGDHVAVVIAESLDEARNAAELVKVDYKVLKGGSGGSIEKVGDRIIKKASNSKQQARWYKSAGSLCHVPRINTYYGDTLDMEFLDGPSLNEVCNNEHIKQISRHSCRN